MKKYHQTYKYLRILFFGIIFPVSLYFFFRNTTPLESFLSISAIFLNLGLINCILIKINLSSKLVCKKRINSKKEEKIMKQVSKILKNKGEYNFLKKRLEKNTEMIYFYFDKKSKITVTEICEILNKLQ